MSRLVDRVIVKEAVLVDSVYSKVWRAHEAGIKDLVADSDGVYIMWNMGSTFVPWANIRCTLEKPVWRGNDSY